MMICRYFLPHNLSKLNSSCGPKYVLERPKGGWKLQGYTTYDSMPLTPSPTASRAPRRDRSRTSSQLSTPHVTSVRKDLETQSLTPVKSNFDFNELTETENGSETERIRELERELYAERQRRIHAEACLQAQQRLLEVERKKLEDMRQEQAAAFITPALLDAFLGIKSIQHGIIQ